MKYLLFIIPLFFVGFFVNTPYYAFGQADDKGDGLPAYCSEITEADKGDVIPCGTKWHTCNENGKNAECEFSHLFVLINNMARSFITLVFAPLLTITLMYIGFLFIKDQAAAKTKAKMLLSRLLIGTFFVLGAWLIVNFILSALETTDEIKSPLETN